VMAVETLALVVAVATADGDNGWRPKQGQRWQRGLQWLMRWQTTKEYAGADNNQQNAAGGISSSGDSGRGSSNSCSVAVMAGRGSGAAEVTTMRAAATATTVITPFSLGHGER
jgi:hypothetical protein